MRTERQLNNRSLVHDSVNHPRLRSSLYPKTIVRLSLSTLNASRGSPRNVVHQHATFPLCPFADVLHSSADVITSTSSRDLFLQRWRCFDQPHARNAAVPSLPGSA